VHNCVTVVSHAVVCFSGLAGDLDDLSSRLQQLALGAAGAPLMTIDTGDAAKQQPQQQQGGAAWRAVAEEDQRGCGDAGEDWELV
jgi:hypothetical protein